MAMGAGGGAGGEFQQLIPPTFSPDSTTLYFLSHYLPSLLSIINNKINKP